MENNNTNKNFAARKAIEELVKGREFANQLKHLINGGNGGGGSGAGGGGGGGGGGDGEQLVRKVLMSFTNSLMILREPSSEFQEATTPLTRINPTKSEDSLESNCKSSSTTKERRGCYKRRRTSQSWEKESEAPIEDGYQWRKYGQKVILNAKHPRNYYRCTHKFDQGCQATKQVQRIQDEPSPLFKTTYYGNHTCRNFLMNPEIILDSNDDNDSPNNNSDKTSSVFLSFGINEQDFTTRFLTSNNFPTTTTTMVKEEYKEEINNASFSSDDDYNNLLSSELTFDNYSNHVTTTLSPNLDSEDVISGALYDPSEFDHAFELLF